MMTEQSSAHPDFARADELMAQLKAGMEQLSATMAQLESQVALYRRDVMIAKAFGAAPPPVPPELEGWV